MPGGQQQRVAIAGVKAHGLRLIVCDEPIGALDHQTGHSVMNLLKDVALHPDRALVIVTYDARNLNSPTVSAKWMTGILLG